MNEATENFQGMERPRGIEPPPTAWQAVVQPLYYGRISVSLNAFFYSMPLMTGQGPAATRRTERITDTHPRKQPGPRHLEIDAGATLDNTWIQSTSRMRVERTTGDFFCRSANRLARSRSI